MLTMGASEETGSITVLALAILALLTVLGNSVVTLSNGELQISRNEGIRLKALYIAEGGVMREITEMAAGRYPVLNGKAPSILATHASRDLPPPVPHNVAGEPYDFTLAYMGIYPPPKGYSTAAFVRYDYEIEAKRKTAGVRVRCGRIGPPVR